MAKSRKDTPRIEYLRVRNFRALHDLELKELTPLTVFLGPNGSGKSTLFDVFAFLSECFTVGLRKAWDKRNRFRELRTRGSAGAIEIVIKYRERRDLPLITYSLKIQEERNNPVVEEEYLQWRRKAKGKPFKFLNFQRGAGEVVSGDQPDEQDERIPEKLKDAETLAVNALGQLARHPRVNALRAFISDWYLSYLSADHARGAPDAGPQERLSATGDNLPNVIQYLNEQHPERLREILETLSKRIPRVERVDAQMMGDGRLLLQIKDAPFDLPILSKFASDGTLKMLAYLVALYDPQPPQLVAIEEPENQLHPRLLPELCEECRHAASRSQLLVTTHSPFFVNGLRPSELWVLYRDQNGYTQVRRAQDMRGIPQFMEQGAKLGDLWIKGFFEVGDPLVNSGGGKHQNPLTAMHLEFLLEELSAEAALDNLLPRMLPEEVSWRQLVFNGKPDLLDSLGGVLRGYAAWITQDYRIVVLLDRDDDDCRELKNTLNQAAKEAGLRVKGMDDPFTVLNRLAVEELEAWILGDPEALRAAYPRVSAFFEKQDGYRDPDAVKGGTWEALERLLQNAGYFAAGLPKIEVARSVSLHMLPERNRSRSFQAFQSGLTALFD